MLILNKVGLAGPGQVEKVRAWLDSRFSRLRIVETNYCQVPYQILLGVGRFDPARAALSSPAAGHSRTGPAGPHAHHRHDHLDVFSTWSYQTDQPLALETLRDAMRKLPGTIYRAKGVVHTTNAPQRRTVLQVVGRRVDISIHDRWGQRTPRTQIVAIGAAGKHRREPAGEHVRFLHFPAPAGCGEWFAPAAVFAVAQSGPAGAAAEEG
jgi:G3E family GTPase